MNPKVLLYNTAVSAQIQIVTKIKNTAFWFCARQEVCYKPLESRANMNGWNRTVSEQKVVFCQVYPIF